jgi:hypothetical protein
MFVLREPTPTGGSSTFVIKQTIQKTSNGPYVVDHDRERFCRPDDDACLARAMRDAAEGRIE